jgi:Ubiquitin family
VENKMQPIIGSSCVIMVEYKFQMPVVVLKEKILDITGVSVEDQRLIFRGRVLNDDQQLSEYRILGHIMF